MFNFTFLFLPIKIIDITIKYGKTLLIMKQSIILLYKPYKYSKNQWKHIQILRTKKLEYAYTYI